MTDFYLTAPDEAALVAALPMLRILDQAGEPCWMAETIYHALDSGVVVVETPAAMNGMTIVAPAVLASGFHANLRLSPWHPGYDAITAAIEPFVVTPTTPSVVFAGEADWGVPASCTKLGLMRALREAGEWSEIRAALQSNPDLWEEWELATELKRTDPLVQGVIAARGYTPDQVDRLIVRATDLVA